MNATEHLAGREWTKPSCYGGFSPDGDYLILSQNRDSGALERSNYTCAFDELRTLCKTLPELDDPNDGRNDWVYDFRASHWACGWVEYLLVRHDAPEELLQAAGEIICSLADYPVLDEDHFSELEMTEAEEYWAGCSVADRLDAIKRSRSDASIFAARREYLPRDDNGYLEQYIRDN